MTVSHNASPPDLSVIIVTYNSRALTLACVASVLAAQAAAQASGGLGCRLAVELIVVDNASTDGTAAALRQAAPQAQVLVQPANLGFARGNNAGLAAARGRYLLLLNSDTEVRAGALAALAAFLDEHPQAGACGPMLLNPDGSLQPSGRDLPTLGSLLLDMSRLHRLWRRDRYAQSGRDYSRVARVGELSAAALLVRRTVYEQVGGLDPALFAYYEDVDWCKRIGDAGYAIYYVPAAQVMHHWQGTSRQVSALAAVAGQDSTRYYFRKHHGRAASWVVQGLLAAKELTLLAAAALRRDQAGRQLHCSLLRRALSPLQSTSEQAVPAQVTP